MVQLNRIIAAAIAGATIVYGHPGQSHASKRAELRARSDYISSLAQTDLVHCVKKLAARGEVEQTVERRSEMLKVLRMKRGLDVNGKRGEDITEIAKSCIGS
jgi:hypothetical protein